MKPPRLLGLAALVLVLAGCAPATPTSTPTAEPEPTVTVAPEPVASAVIVSLDGLAIQDETGATMESAVFTDPNAVLALLSSILGSTPTPTEFPEFGSRSYEWPGVLLGVGAGDTFSWFRSEAADLGGLPLETSDGIHLGSTRAEVLALGPFDLEYDMDGDGSSDLLGIEQETVPGTQSLSFPGQPGTAFVEVQLVDDAVTVLRSPSNDYSDV